MYLLGAQQIIDGAEPKFKINNNLIRLFIIANKLIKLKATSKRNKLKNLTKIKKELENKYKIQIDYLEFRDEKKLKLNNFKSKYRLFIAYYINGVRLIDNF